MVTIAVMAMESLVFVSVAHGQKMYWTNSYGTQGKILRADVDGTNVEDLISAGLDEPHGIALDVIQRKIYWSETGRIRRANLDGSNIENVITVGVLPYGIALDPRRAASIGSILATARFGGRVLTGRVLRSLSRAYPRRWESHSTSISARCTGQTSTQILLSVLTSTGPLLRPL